MKKTWIVGLGLFSIALFAFWYVNQEQTVTEEYVNEEVSKRMERIDKHADALIAELEQGEIPSSVSQVGEASSSDAQPQDYPLSSPVFSDITEQVSADWLTVIKDAANIADDSKNEALLSALRKKLNVDTLIDEQLASVYLEKPGVIGLLQAPDYQLTDAELSEKNLITERVEKLLEDKKLARQELENNIREQLTPDQQVGLDKEINRRVDEAVANYVDVFKGYTEKYIPSLNDYQRGELEKVFTRHKESQVRNVTLGSIMNRQNSILANDDPASLEFMATLQNDVQNQLDSVQVESLMQGVRSELSTAIDETNIYGN